MKAKPWIFLGSIFLVGAVVILVISFLEKNPKASPPMSISSPDDFSRESSITSGEMRPGDKSVPRPLLPSILDQIEKAMGDDKEKITDSSAEESYFTETESALQPLVHAYDNTIR